MDVDRILEELEALESEVDVQNGTEVAVYSVAWGQLHESILDALLDGDEEWESVPVQTLAKQLKSEVGELRTIFEGAPKEQYTIRRIEKILERQEMSRIGYNWSSLESSVLQKLSHLVRSNAIRASGDLLAIAKTANSAIRRGNTTGVPQMTEKPTQPGGLNLNVNQFNGVSLPGAGSLGRIELSLSQRTIDQLSRDRTLDLKAERLDERIEMLGANDVPELTKKADDLA